MSKTTRNAVPLIVVSVVLAAGTFLLDLALPLGVAGGVPYVVLVLISLWSPRRRDTFIAAAVGTILTILGFYFSSPGSELWVVIANRLLAIFAIWTTAILSLYHNWSQEKLRKKRDNLEKLVVARTADLRAGEERHRTLIESSHEVVFSKDRYGRYQTANLETAIALGGTCIEDVLGKTDHDLMSKESADALRTVDEQVMKDEKVLDVEEVVRDLEGEDRVYLSRKWPTYDGEGQITGIACFAMDVTDRRRVEEEQRLQSEIATNMNEGIFLIRTSDYTIAYTNPRFEELFGYGSGEMIGKPVSIVNAPTEMTPEETVSHIVGLLKQTGGWAGEIQNIKKDGTPFWCYASASLFQHSEFGEVIVSVHTDITDRKRSEERHEALEAQLRQSQKMEAIGQLAGGVAHDFNNLLQAMLGFGDLAVEEAEKGSPVHTSLEEMLQAGHRAKALVSQLLAFSRQQVLDIRVVDLNEVITDLTKMIRRVIGEHITLDVLPGRNLGNVRADRGQLDQILMNLCVNARDAMPKGGTITIETENVQVDEAYCETHAWAEQGRYVLLTVTDTGAGMDEETLANVFEPFFTTKDVGEGSGLGLAMVYGLVKQHDGLIHADSKVGKGTTVRIYLPLVERSAEVVEHKDEGPVLGGTETILLAEDEEIVRKLTETILERAGYTVLTACDGEDALRVFEENAGTIDLALLDVMMPKLGGRAVFEGIRNARPDIRVLFCSGYSMDAIHTDFVLDDGMELLQKPYPRDALLRRVRGVLDA